jgi:hypothetical protein
MFPAGVGQQAAPRELMRKAGLTPGPEQMSLTRRVHKGKLIAKPGLDFQSRQI